MITLDTVLDKLGWRVTGGGAHGWKCYGANTRSLEIGSEWDPQGLHIYVVFDPSTKQVFEISGSGPLYELTENNPWRWIDEDHQTAFRNECTRRKIKWQIAWDTVSYNSLEDAEVIQMLDLATDALAKEEDKETSDA
jgi:hypothetical protein